MKTRSFPAALLLALLMILAFDLTGGVTAQKDQPIEKPEMASSANVTLVSISPSSFANQVNMPVTITGSNLDTVTAARLGTVALRNLEIISSTQVTALVPWSIVTGTHDLTVQSPGEPDAVLPDAVTVSAGSTDWTSNGPYGGGSNDIVVDSVDPSRVYVAAGRSGLWRSQNGGTNWDFSFITPFPGRVQMTYPISGQPPVMYLGIGIWPGVVRSLDYGQTWEPKGLTSTINGETRAYVRPDQSNWVYASVDQNDDPLGGLYKSTDQGEHWALVSGTGGLRVQALAFDPDYPDNMIIGTATGQVYTTTNDGVTWSNPITFTNKVGRLYFAPTLYNSQRSLFATPCNFQGECNNEDKSYRSTDGGQTWITLTVTPTLYNEHGLVQELAFHDSIPGLMWAAVGDGYYSEDGGATWNPVGAGLHEVRSFAIVPGATIRQTTTLFATDKGHLYKSTDGGETWQETDTGLGTELARTIAISPFNADEAYIATNGKGLMHTFDGGRNWQSLPAPIGYYDAPIAPDPFTNGKVYFGYGTRSEISPTVRVSSDHGFTFTEHGLTLPPECADQSASVAAIAPDPQIPNRLLAGVCLVGNPGPGLIYASADGGVTWTQQATPAGIKCIRRLVFDPNNPNVVYAGSYGSGVLRSTDRGATWTLLEHQPAGTQILPLVIDPGDSNSIYVGARDNDAGGLYASHNGGDTWVKMTGTGNIWELKFCKVGESNWLYAATMNGLRYLRAIPDDPTTPWESASGIAGVATVDGFNAATEDGRVVYYVGTSGGTVYPSSSDSRHLITATSSQNMAGGIYRAMALESLYAAPGWQLRNQSGFGNFQNRIYALEIFNGQLYAATTNYADGGARVWRLIQGNNWTPASEVGMSPIYSQTNPAIYDLVTFDGQLYAAVGLGANEGQIWRTANGSDWNKVTGSEFGGDPHRNVTVMTVFSHTLYAAANGLDVEIWRSSTGDSGSWVRVAQDGFGNPNNSWVTGAAVLNDALYVSVSNSVEGITIWRTANGTDWTQVNTSGFGDAANAYAGGMATLGGYLYVGTRNDTTGGQVWRFDGANWSQVVADGFGNVNNIRIDSLYTVQNGLFAVTRNATTGLQVWRTDNGVDWTALNLNGLGNVNNVGAALWANSSAVFGNSYFVSVQNDISGGEVWQYAYGGFSVYLPLVTR
ncbi:MAG: IPT/TIG domain-containing protein [Chloroflexi bacterium]|nr:IPT/TIG domain-containing protein [Chloroflexota bacterium]